MTTLLDALAALRPGSAFTMAPGDFATLRWQDPDHDQPTLDAVLAKQAELEAEARIDAVKAEARRRITQRFPDWKQANMTARGVELLNIRVAVGSWTAPQAQEAAELGAAWDWIKTVRAASDAIEALAPIPADFASDTRWPES
ncbi:MAG TPA: hypothetical protein VIV01_16970 [Hyphomicrobiaceae bacterium]|jgi:hypothetical protein